MEIGSKLKQYLALLGNKSTWGFHILENGILMVGVFMISLLVLLEVVLRFTMRAMPLGLEETALIVGAWMYFIGIAVAMRDRRHVIVDFLDLSRMPRLIQKALEPITIFLNFSVCGFMSYVAIGWCLFVAERHFNIQPWGISALVSYTSMAVGFTLASLYLLAQLIQNLRGK